MVTGFLAPEASSSRASTGRRWYRDLRNRDLLGTSLTTQADHRLKECARRFDEYADAVYARLGTPAAGD